MGDSYNDSNRAFLQAFMGRSSMTFDEAQPVLAAILSVQREETVDPTDITEEHLSSYISAANTAISPFDLEIRSSFRQTPKQPDQENTDTPPTRVYALVNTTSDPLTQLATTYSADEIAFVKRLLDYMFDTNNNRLCEGMVITSMQALNIRSSAEANRRRSTNAAQTQTGAAQSLTMTQAENMMKHLVDEGWLEKSRKDYFSLTPRALMELRGWLVSEYNDETDDGRRMNRIKFCAACKDIITVGQRCGNRDCRGRLHDHCMRNFFRIQRAEKCPVCKADWPGDNFVGERAAAAGARRQTNARQAPPTVPNGHVSGEEDASGSEDASGEEEEG
ncbi:DNA repair protein Nse1 [Penicillium lividum]|nr:DNA repair protein Nse1 [Penicillium lividum]